MKKNTITVNGTAFEVEIEEAVWLNYEPGNCIGKTDGFATVGLGKFTAVVAVVGDRANWRDVRQVIEGPCYTAHVTSEENRKEVFSFIRDNSETLLSLKLADIVICRGGYDPLVKEGYVAVPMFRVSGTKYLIMRKEVLEATEEFLARR